MRGRDGWAYPFVLEGIGNGARKPGARDFGVFVECLAVRLEHDFDIACNRIPAEQGLARNWNSEWEYPLDAFSHRQSFC